jgi:hypothetical protein
MRECTKCGMRLGETDFYTPYGPCKSCAKKAVAEWRAKNRERHNENARRWREANPDKIAETNRGQYQKNKTERNAYGKRWAEQNRDKCRAAEKRWRDKPTSKATMCDNAREWRKANPERALAAERRWRAKNPHMVCAFAKTRRARKKGAAVADLTAAQWRTIQERADHRCAYCDKRCKGRLTQDHVIPLSKGGHHTASNIAPACGPCNSRKHTGPPPRPVQPLLVL